MVSKIYLSVNSEKQQKEVVVSNIINEASLRNIDVVSNIKDCDAIISVGGDGTFLYASHQALEYNKIVCGINLGRYGFLPSFKETEIAQMFDALGSEQDFIVEKSLIQVDAKSTKTVVINEVVIERSRSDRAVRLEVGIAENDSVLETDVFVADGIIVATPTGSTAYASSAGGPVLEDSTNSMVMTFVALHHPKVPGIVLGANKTISITNQEEAVLACDGKCLMELEPNTEIKVTYSEKKLKVCEKQPSILQRLLAKA